MDVKGKPMDRTKSFESFGIFVVLFFLAGSSLAEAADGLARETRPGSWKADASLTDVTFLDRQRGWAVGSQGVLLRTEDGGKTWGEGNLATTNQKVQEAPLTEKFQRIRANQQMGIADGADTSNFSCRFETVCFTDEKNGWAAGGYDLPWLNHSRAVIARTLDGGRSWQSLPRLMIGRIQKIEFRGMQRLSGWAIGANDPGSDASLFFTSDAGNIWSSQKSERMPDLIDAETAGNRFVGIDSKGQPVHFDSSKFEHAVIMGGAEPVLDDLLMTDNKNGFAVGHNGLFMKTNNAGLSWSTVEENSFLKSFDFRCVHATENHIWFAGNPGHVLFSYDRNKNELKSHPLHGASSINAIHFVDPEYGWAVGDLGQIWCTKDGGENWTLQRSGSPQGPSKVGVLAVCTDDDMPLEFFARHAGEDGKLIGAVIPQNENIDAVRLAAERVGVAVVAPIEFKHEDDLALLRKTVRTIRHWRPSVVVGTDRAFLEKAVRLAASENSLPQQLATGLKVWQPRYLMVSDPNGPIKYEDSIFLPRIGSLLDDFVMPSRMIRGLPIKPDDTTAFFAWRFDGSGAGARLVEIEGSPFSKEAVAKRRKESVAIGSLSSVKRASQKRDQFKWLINQQMDSVLDVEECKRRISQLAFQLNATPNGRNVAGIWLTQLANEFISVGKHQQAAFALETLARSYPRHYLAPLASTTLARYYSSAEFNQQSVNNWKALRKNVGQASRIPAGAKQGPQNVMIQQSNPGEGITEYRWNKVDLASALEDAAAMPLDLEIDVEEELKNFDPDTVDLSLDIDEPEPNIEVRETKSVPMTDAERDVFLRQRLRNAASEFSRLANRDPGLVKRTDFLYLQAHIVEMLGGADEAKPYFQKVARSQRDPKFVRAASEELKRNDNQLSQIVLTSERPHLDGLPNDAVWQKVMKAEKTINMGTVNSGILTDVAMIARDEEYLYVYTRCYKARYLKYEQSSDQPRRRDEDLSQRHRVELLIDVDRDLSSSWKVEVDWRGHVRESCGGDISWNPKMFVARHIDDSIWSVECAIPINDLVDRIGPDSAWRVNVRRAMEPKRPRHAFWGPSENRPYAEPDALVSFGAASEKR